MAEKNQSGPEKANQRQDPQPMATKPVHARIISENAVLDTRFNQSRSTRLRQGYGGQAKSK
jgi:hypothetical protein